jgi:hypothetical protein|tara:strand:- start:120 stop:299 length:180 start_codon:yes stop_codon:yes gene_type:complete
MKEKCAKGLIKTKRGCKKRVAKKTHRMPDGGLMTGSTHSKNSRPVATKAKGKQRKMYGY